MREHLRSWLEEAGATEQEVFEIVIATTEASRTRSSIRRSQGRISSI
jgi:hypothetical protein